MLRGSEGSTILTGFPRISRAGVTTPFLESIYLLTSDAIKDKALSIMSIDLKGYNNSEVFPRVKGQFNFVEKSKRKRSIKMGPD